MTNIIGKEDFVSVINDIQSVRNYQECLNNFFRKNKVDGYIFQPNCIDTALLLLHIIFGENDNDNMIEYFCFELEFGKKWKPNMITDTNGSDVKLETPEDLYDYLCKKY